MVPALPSKNQLYFGDNLEVMQKYIPDESVDLVYLDPPFNSNRNYSVIFDRKGQVDADDTAQIQAFEDTWHWTHHTESQYTDFIAEAPGRVADAMSAFLTLLGENDAMAYLVNMAPRLQELYRVLKPTGSLYLHCDPTMSHYLKVLLDAIFDARNFRNEIVWQRTPAKALMTTRLPSNHDVLLAYSKSENFTWNLNEAFLSYDHTDLPKKTLEKYSLADSDGRQYQLTSLINPNSNRPNLTYEFLGVTKVWRWTKERMQKAYDEGLVVQTKPGAVPRQKRYLDEQRGVPLNDVWTDIPPLNSQAAERLGYPTQKPVKLLERILSLATSPDDVVLDPFCGCGTTVDAAQKLGRRWIGIDITYISVDLIEKRLLHTYGDAIVGTYKVNGIPHDLAAARAMFNQSAFEFERWAVAMVGGQPNQKQVGDKGIDGVARFPTDARGGIGKVLISVKGGQTLNPAMVRDLDGTVRTQKADMGVLVTLADATKGVKDQVDHGGLYVHPGDKRQFPRIQHVTISDLLKGQRPALPPLLMPYIQAKKQVVTYESDTLFDH